MIFIPCILNGYIFSHLIIVKIFLNFFNCSKGGSMNAWKLSSDIFPFFLSDKNSCTTGGPASSICSPDWRRRKKLLMFSILFFLFRLWFWQTFLWNMLSTKSFLSPLSFLFSTIYFFKAQYASPLGVLIHGLEWSLSFTSGWFRNEHDANSFFDKLHLCGAVCLLGSLPQYQQRLKCGFFFSSSSLWIFFGDFPWIVDGFGDNPNPTLNPIALAFSATSCTSFIFIMNPRMNSLIDFTSVSLSPNRWFIKIDFRLAENGIFSLTKTFLLDLSLSWLRLEKYYVVSFFHCLK